MLTHSADWEGWKEDVECAITVQVRQNEVSHDSETGAGDVS